MRRALSRSIVGLALVVAGIDPGFARAQGTTEAPDPKTLAYLQRLFSEGRLARVRSHEGERVIAGPAFTAEGLRDVDSSGVVKLTSWSQIDRIDARAGSPSRGALVGAIVGAGTGVFLGFVAALAGDGDGGWPTLIGTTALGAATGAVVGATVGSLFPGWQKVYPGQVSHGSSWGLEKK